MINFWIYFVILIMLSFGMRKAQCLTLKALAQLRPTTAASIMSSVQSTNILIRSSGLRVMCTSHDKYDQDFGFNDDDNSGIKVKVSNRLTQEDIREIERVMQKENTYVPPAQYGGSHVRKNSSDYSKKSGERPRNTTARVNALLAKDIDGGRESAAMRGFLEQNPYICSGCGAQFQSTTENNPGYLPKEKFRLHKERAELVRAKQEAIKVLNMADIDLNSDAAVEILQAAGKSPEIISGVQQLGINLTAAATEGGGAGTNTEQQQQQQYFGGVPGDKGFLYEHEAHMLENLPTLRDLKAAERLKATGSAGPTATSSSAAAVDALAPCVCQRCFKLRQYGTVQDSLRPGWSENDLLSPARFEHLLSGIKNAPGVMLCLVDIFDLHGSILPNLKSIAGDNPIIIAANKIDLLPKDASMVRIGGWIHTAVKNVCGLKGPRDKSPEELELLEARRRLDGGTAGEDSFGDYFDEFDVNIDTSPEALAGASARKQKAIKNAGLRKLRKKLQINSTEGGILPRSNVHLVSAQTGYGMDKLMSSMYAMAKGNGNKIYVMGTANVGKSSFINRLLESDKKYGGNKNKNNKKKSSSSSAFSSSIPSAAATVSNLPGTTLDFLKLKLPNGVTVVDTPGLINKGQLTAKLNVEELKQVVPSKPINAVTLRIEEGRCILLGGLASIEMIEGRPFFCTFFVSNEVKMHVTSSYKSQSVLQAHVGKLMLPPNSMERITEIGPYIAQDFIVEGDSWKQSSTDVVIAGLGWVAITGPGRCVLRVTAPEGTAVELRPALLPFESEKSRVKFTGGKLMKKSIKGRGTQGYGWRA